MTTRMAEPTPRQRRPAHGIDALAIARSRSRTAKQREDCVRFLEYATACAPTGGPVDRTWRQLAKGLGKPTEGLTDRQCRNRYRGQIYRTIDYLVAWGLLDGRRTLYEPTGEGRCIVFSLSAGVAQSVRAGQPPPPRRGPHSASQAPDRGGPGRRPHFFSSEVCTPSREQSSLVTRSLEESSAVPANGGASARVTVGSREGWERRLVHADRRRREVAAVTAIGALRGNDSPGEWGARLVAQGAVLEAPVSTVARALLERELPSVHRALSTEWQSKLEAAARRIDHYAGYRGAWVELAASIIGAWAQGEAWGWCSEPPRSLGALAVELKREANLLRYYALGRRTERLRPLAAARRRQQIKRWRRDQRELGRGCRFHPGMLRKPWRDE